MGSITSTKNWSYEENTLITLTATPLDNFEFVGYFEGDSLVSNKLNYQFNLTKNTSLEGILKKKKALKVSYKLSHMYLIKLIFLVVAIIQQLEQILLMD